MPTLQRLVGLALGPSRFCPSTRPGRGWGPDGGRRKWERGAGEAVRGAEAGARRASLRGGRADQGPGRGFGRACSPLRPRGAPAGVGVVPFRFAQMGPGSADHAGRGSSASKLRKGRDEGRAGAAPRASAPGDSSRHHLPLHRPGRQRIVSGALGTRLPLTRPPRHPPRLRARSCRPLPPSESAATTPTAHAPPRPLPGSRGHNGTALLSARMRFPPSGHGGGGSVPQTRCCGECWRNAYVLGTLLRWGKV